MIYSKVIVSGVIYRADLSRPKVI